MIKCKVCNKELLYINTTHLKYCCGLSVKEYMEKYGDVFSDEVRKKLSVAQKGKKMGDKNPAKREEVKQRIKGTVKKLWDTGVYDNRINGMLGVYKELNPNWKEEIHTFSYLAEHKYRDFLEQFQSVDKCFYCGKEAKNIHHIDENKKNFMPSNLVPLCIACHQCMHIRWKKEPFITAVKEVKFASAHKLPFYNGLCSNWHGHEFKMLIGIKMRINKYTGMVMDFKDLKNLLEKTVIALFDHDILNKYFENPYLFVLPL